MTIQGATDPDAGLFDDEAREYDAVLVMSFGGPEGLDDVLPFLENVVRGRRVPRERFFEVAHHYDAFGGVSPINEQNRKLVEALERELAEHGISLPVYLGNRNWHPFVGDTMREMTDDGIRRALVFLTSGFSSYSGCRQYREDILRAREAVGDGAPVCDRVRMFFNHPGFIEPVADNVRRALERLPGSERDRAHVAFTAHSIPMAMAGGCEYVPQLTEACRLVAACAGLSDYAIVYQSRSGPPQVPWLEPDILDHMETLGARGTQAMVIVPIGFLSDHLEVLFDLDTEAAEKAAQLGMVLERAATVGAAPRFVSMIRELIAERLSASPERVTLGDLPPSHDICPVDCCLERPAGSRDA